ncbi:MAG: 50S ribosomal protein L35 [Gammaproteobacteria bacterium]|nr:50S ribosomal protein L35 [Gammaproteobacteria bacterium]
MKTKLKTHSGSKKRFKRTASGSYVHRAANRGHRFTGKPRKRKRQLRGMRPIHPSDHRAAKMLLNDRAKTKGGEIHG